MGIVRGTFTVLLLSYLFYCCAAIGCISESNKPVDWWFIYKLPALAKDPNTDLNDGFGYAYLDSESSSLEIVPSRLLNQGSHGSLSWTLQQIYKSDTVGYIMWNDNTPDNKTNTYRGHTKGVLAFTSRTGFLLRHSTPRFPSYKKDGYDGFPAYGRIYGQTFLCISLDTETVDDIAYHYTINAANVYDQFVPPLVASKYPNISALANGTIAQKIEHSVITIKSIGGNVFADFAKSRTCQCELYADLLAPFFKTDILALTWGRPLTPPYCKPQYEYSVGNIVNVTWVVNQTVYSDTKEHSKWAIAFDTQELTFPAAGPIACIGDINRMESQRNRGGGTSCFAHPGLWKGLYKLISGVDSCPIASGAV